MQQQLLQGGSQDGHESGRLGFGADEQLVEGFSLQLPAGDALELQLAGRRWVLSPLGHRGLADPERFGRSLLRQEVTDDVFGAHAPQYRSSDGSSLLGNHRTSDLIPLWRGKNLAMKAIAKAPATLADRVADLMKVRGFTRQEDLAEAAGIKQSSLSDLVRGVTTPEKVRASTLVRLASALGTTWEYLWEGAAGEKEQATLEAELLSIYRQVDGPHRFAILQSARTARSAHEAAHAATELDERKDDERTLAAKRLPKAGAKKAAKDHQQGKRRA